METAKRTAEEITYGEDLISYIFARNPVFYDLTHLFRQEKKSPHFSNSVGDAILHVWYKIHDSVSYVFRRDFPSFLRNKETFKNYLMILKDKLGDFYRYKPGGFIVLSAIFLELICFLYRRGITHYVYSAPYYWLVLFKLYVGNDFYDKGGWTTLKTIAENQIEYQTESLDELYSQFWWPSTKSKLSSAFRKSSPRNNDQSIDYPYNIGGTVQSQIASAAVHGQSSNEMPKEQLEESLEKLLGNLCIDVTDSSISELTECFENLNHCESEDSSTVEDDFVMIEEKEFEDYDGSCKLLHAVEKSQQNYTAVSPESPQAEKSPSLPPLPIRPWLFRKSRADQQGDQS